MYTGELPFVAILAFRTASFAMSRTVMSPLPLFTTYAVLLFGLTTAHAGLVPTGSLASMVLETTLIIHAWLSVSSSTISRWPSGVCVKNVGCGPTQISVCNELLLVSSTPIDPLLGQSEFVPRFSMYMYEPLREYAYTGSEPDRSDAVPTTEVAYEVWVEVSSVEFGTMTADLPAVHVIHAAPGPTCRFPILVSPLTSRNETTSRSPEGFWFNTAT